MSVPYQKSHADARTMKAIIELEEQQTVSVGESGRAEDARKKGKEKVEIGRISRWKSQEKLQSWTKV